MADYTIKKIEGVEEAYAFKLQEAGIKIVANLLERGKPQRAGRT